MAPFIRTGEGGFTYLAALFLLAVLTVLTARAMLIWHMAEQRERERQLLFVGEQYRRAIQEYHDLMPGTEKHFPQKMEDLLDGSGLTTKTWHPIRRLFRDPMTGSTQWGVITASDGGIQGVYSLSTQSPIKVAGFADNEQDFAVAKSYEDWKFVYQPPKDAPTDAIGH